MRHDEYDRMSELEENYWWHVGREHIIRKQLNKLNLDPASAKIINIGSGTGATIPLLERYGTVTNVDTSPAAIAKAKEKGYQTIKIDRDSLPFDDSTFDLAVAFDVLEHIPDDFAALRDWQRILKPSGHLMVTVPAHNWLWSAHDESLHHYRRYTVSQVHRLCNLAGFDVVKRSYAISFSFPMIVAYRFLSSLIPGRRHNHRTSYVRLPRPINAFFAFLLRIEGTLLKYINAPIGTSVLVVAVKEEHPSHVYPSHTEEP